MTRSLLVGAAILFGLTALTSCASPGPGVAPPPTSTPGAPTLAPSPSPIALSCDTIVTPEALASLTSNGQTANPEFADKMRDEGSDLVHFLDYGGVACQWGTEGTDATSVLAYAQVTEVQAKVERSYLVSQGWTQALQADGSENWSPESLENYLGNTPRYEFRPGSIRYMLDVSSRDYFAM
jgi:hypothetical protein